MAASSVLLQKGSRMLSFIRAIAAVACGLVGVTALVVALVWLTMGLTGTALLGTSVRVHHAQGHLNWEKLLSGLLLGVLAVGMFYGAWELWP
jgi:hypothetical protein